MTDLIQCFSVADVGPDPTDPDMFLEVYLKSNGLPELSELTLTEKQCQLRAEKAREDYKAWSEGRERMHMGFQVRTSMLPNSMKYAYRLYRNKKSAHASKVYKTAYRHLLAKRLLEMEAVIASYGVAAEHPLSCDGQISHQSKNTVVGQCAYVKHEAKNINDVNFEVCNQKVCIEFNEEEIMVTAYGMTDSELIKIQLFVNNLEGPPEQVEPIRNPWKSKVTDSYNTGTMDEDTVLYFGATTTGADSNSDGSKANGNVYGNDLGAFGDCGVEGKHVPQHHCPGHRTNSGGFLAGGDHQVSAPARITNEHDYGVIHVKDLRGRSKDGSPFQNDGYSTGGSAIVRFTHLHRCNETFTRLFSSNVAGGESGNDLMFQEIMTEALAEEISHVELPQAEKLG